MQYFTTRRGSLRVATDSQKFSSLLSCPLCAVLPSPSHSLHYILPVSPTRPAAFPLSTCLPLAALTALFLLPTPLNFPLPIAPPTLTVIPWPHPQSFSSCCCFFVLFCFVYLAPTPYSYALFLKSLSSRSKNSLFSSFPFLLESGMKPMRPVIIVSSSFNHAGGKIWFQGPD